ncbi:hypothetical protein [Halovibrio sp. HP20-59]|uniref:hypothetical protein n=1 Tax=Halovibrio sp. HP20-59 TaxID=3080275 RepID=UPI002AFE1842|nr:hypothetical protein [Halovibrio sp. HP20-59]
MSAGYNVKGQRVIDLSEMIRVYGEALSTTRHPTPEKQTPPDMPDTTALVDELRALREEICNLRDEVKELRLLPAPQQKVEQSSAPGTSNSKQRHQFSDFIDALRKSES